MEGQEEEKEEEKKSNFQKHRVKLVLKNRIDNAITFFFCNFGTFILQKSIQSRKIQNVQYVILNNPSVDAQNKIVEGISLPYLYK